MPGDSERITSNSEVITPTNSIPFAWLVGWVQTVGATLASCPQSIESRSPAVRLLATSQLIGAIEVHESALLLPAKAASSHRVSAASSCLAQGNHWVHLGGAAGWKVAGQDGDGEQK